MSAAQGTALDAMLSDRVICVVRAPHLADVAGLCEALVGAGIRTVELTMTTPHVLEAVYTALEVPGVFLGVGTVLQAGEARELIDAGARFLVTPGLRPRVAELARAAGVPVLMGALTPTEVLSAHEMGAAAVKIFPASAHGPAYLRALRGPHPDIALVPSGGVDASNAAAFLAAGAAAVTAGTSVVPPSAVAAGDHHLIAARAREFMQSLTP